MDHRDLRTRSQLISLLVLSSVIGEPLSESRTSRALISRIVNGTQASTGQFPQQVSLRKRYNNHHFCGGSVLNREWILTAAHCMFQNGLQIRPWSVLIVAGNLLLNETLPGEQSRSVSRIIVHEGFDATTTRHDVAVMKLSEPLNIDEVTVAAARLQFRRVPVGSKCYVSGWGYPEEGVKELIKQLMYVDVSIIDHSLCNKLYSKLGGIYDGMICAGYLEGMKDACQGDSGGGMICNGVLSGVVSGGYKCAWPNYPGVYADVVYYRRWILKTTGMNKVADNRVDRATFFLTTILTLSSFVKVF